MRSADERWRSERREAFHSGERSERSEESLRWSGDGDEPPPRSGGDARGDASHGSGPFHRCTVNRMRYFFSVAAVTAPTVRMSSAASEVRPPSTRSDRSVATSHTRSGTASDEAWVAGYRRT